MIVLEDKFYNVSDYNKYRYTTSLLANTIKHMDTTEPKYFTKFRQFIEKRLDLVDNRFDLIDNRFDLVDNRFDSIDQRLNGLDENIDSLAISTKNQFDEFGGEFSGLKTEFIKLKTEMNSRFEMVDYEISDIKNTMATKEEVKDILSHIGRYEVRTQNIEETLKSDHEPRIKNLEKSLLAI